MTKALDAYTNKHILEYFEAVQRDGLTEHGFARLTSNIGILICHGIRTELLPLFCDMMEFCCKNIPHSKAGNDFTVKEIIFCIMELEKNCIVNGEIISRWKGYLREIEPLICYNTVARTENDSVYNWALFTAVSEYMRQYISLCNTEDFVDIQVASQLKWLDENGMYQDAPINPPMIYDLVPRGLFAVLLHFGYKGRYYREIDDCLRKTGVLTLKMQSVTGETAYGGRSNQFLYNEALLAIIYEYEANRYVKEGNLPLAEQFKTMTERAIANTEYWLNEKTIRHIKNRFPLESRYGCEDYAYFDKYMITVASYLYTAYLICEDTVQADDNFKEPPVAFCTSDNFHKVFLKSSEYALEFDTRGDLNYDASGLGRIHKEGAPSAICLSLPCSDSPNYVIDKEGAVPLSLCPGVLREAKWHFATDSETKYELFNLFAKKECAIAEFMCLFSDGERVRTGYIVDKNGVEIVVNGEGSVAYMLPAFYFDGENYPEITLDKNCLSVFYMGWICRYTTDGIISDTGNFAYNRNGCYRAFYSSSKDTLHIKVEIFKV